MAISKARATPLKDNWKCILICLAMSMANCQYGFDTATIGGFQAMIGFLKVFGYRDPERELGWNIRTKPQQLITSFLNVGTIAGALCTHPFARYFGRKAGVWVACTISFVAAGVQLGVTTLGGLYAGRLLLGVANGFFITFANTYTSEVSPAHLRALLVSFFGIWVTIGSILGTVADNFSKNYQSKLAYQIPLASLFALPFFLGIFVFFIPESPRWLLVHDRPEQARKALQRLRGTSLKAELFEEEYIEMVRGIEEEKELAAHSSLLDIFRGPDLRRTILCVAVILSRASSGIWLVIAYGTFFFQMAGINKPFQASVLSTVASFIGVVVGLYLMLKVFGRRVMMILGSVCAAACMLAIGVAYTVAPNSTEAGKAIVGFTLMYGAFYNGFAGTISWPIANELVSSRLRILTISVGTAVDYFASWLVSYTAPYFLNSNSLNWGPKYAYIWAGSNAITALFFYLYLPEMKGRSLEEIDELFNNRVSVKDFRTYQCVSSERAKEIAVKEVHHHDDDKEHGATVAMEEKV